MAKLYFRYGTMSSGKTALLLQVAYNYEKSNMKTLLLKPEIDTKGEDFLVSRIGLKRKVDFKINESDKIYKKLQNKLENISCILVDEAQFLKKEQVDDLMKIVIDKNIPIICYGLRTDFQTNGFEGAKRLLEIAHTIEEIKTICECGKKAIFNVRKINNKLVFSGNQIAIDGENKVEYESLCAHCYLKKRKETLNK